ncbi:hypothetical protein EDE08_103331 [Bradyrhizobium sp. R2.2-H]|jgi:hypothetical protein|uniref:hypothetical protein n=1 Tax=unclassified Bradyrhizobium TaxID=2631580 RepID=UPI001042ED3F|nr:MULTISPECIES: hypothetical protein [unclassified Bradyrhizobium]TCU75114.1 hypothetical protein EDE10_103330 [Bradyrhizobium sp. Y-H1]TCU77882.1 hypothetical protein EDE08_103331 [Bradyrhizobium sp. R2.2-H]
MATSGDLAKALSKLLNEPFSTVDLYGRHLRAAGLLNIKGYGRGAAEMTARDAAAWLIALAIDHERGGDFAKEVKRVLDLPMHEYLLNPKNYADDLQHAAAKTAGHGLALFIGDMMVPRIRDRLERGDDLVTANFDADGVFVSLSIFEHTPGEVGQFASTTYQRGERKRRDVERLTVVHGRILLEIAKLLELKPPA